MKAIIAKWTVERHTERMVDNEGMTQAVVILPEATVDLRLFVTGDINEFLDNVRVGEQLTTFGVAPGEGESSEPPKRVYQRVYHFTE